MKVCSLINKPIKCGTNAIHQELSRLDNQWNLVCLRKAKKCFSTFRCHSCLCLSLERFLNMRFLRDVSSILNEYDVVLVDGLVNFYLILLLQKLDMIRGETYFLVHNDYVALNTRTNYKLVPNQVFTFLYDFALKRHRKNICVSHNTKKFLDDRGVNSLVVPNGISMAQQVKKCTSSDLNIWYIGRLIRLKCIDILIESLANVDEPYTLNVVGDGPELKYLKSLAIKKNVNVKFFGFLNSPFEYVKPADIFVLPSLVEGRSIALMEALAQKCFVIASDIDGNSQFSRFGVKMFKSGCPISLVSHLQEAIDMRVDGRSEYIERYFDSVVNELSSEAMLDSYKRIFYV